MEMTTVRRVCRRSARGGARRVAAATARRRDQVPILARISMPRRAAAQNQATLVWPCGMTMKAAISGPIACPELPPT